MTAYSQAQLTNQFPPNTSSGPLESYPPWMDALMQDPRFLAHIVLPQAVHAPQNRHLYPAQPNRSVKIHPTVRIHRDYGSTARRRHHHQSMKRRHAQSRGAIPASYLPQQVISIPRPSQQHQAALVSPVHLLHRPTNWRRGYHSPSKGGFGRYLIKLGSLIHNPSPLRTPFRANPLISFNIRRATPISYNLRMNPLSEPARELSGLGRAPNALDLFQLATSPPTHRIVVWHPKLPWYIKLDASNSNGLTVQDVLVGLHTQLKRPITQNEYYNVELTSFDRQMLSLAFQERCKGDAGEMKKGVRRVDFLGRELEFVGLVRSRKGMWELKTAVPERPRMLLD